MAKQTKQVQKFIIDTIDKILPDGNNKKLYEDLFKNMSDKDFEIWLGRIRDKKTHLVLIAPIYSKVELNLERNIKLAKDIFKHDFFQRLWVGPKDEQPKYLTPFKYLVIDLSFRRLSQTLIKKMAVAKNNKRVDMLTYQPTGRESKAAKISYNELQILAGYGLDDSIVELIKYRGGDKGGFRAMNLLIDKYGRVNMETLQRYATGVESTKTLKTFLTAMHLKNTL